MRRSLAALLTGLLASFPVAASAQAPTLKLSFFTSATEVNYTRVIKPWIDAVNADPSGAVKIEGYPDGALGKSFPAQPQLILDGVADIAWTNPSVVPGRFPDDQVFELPGLILGLKEGVLLYEALIKANALRGYQDYVVVGSFMNPPYNLFSRKPLKTPKDIKGLKVRIIGQVLGQTVKELGGVPVLMSPGEVVEAMGRGTVDAALAVPASLVDFGIDRVTSHDYLIPLGGGPLNILMSRAKYQSLPKEAQAVLDKYGLEYLNQRYIAALGSYNNELVAKLKADPKRTVVAPTAAEMDSVKPAYDKVIAEWTAKAPRNAELLAQARGILAKIRSN